MVPNEIQPVDLDFKSVGKAYIKNAKSTYRISV